MYLIYYKSDTLVSILGLLLSLLGGDLIDIISKNKSF